VVLAAIALSPSLASAQVGVLDQSSPGAGASFNRDAASLVWQQQAHTGVAGQLEGIRLFTAGAVTSKLNVRIRKGAAPSSQAILFSALVGKTTSTPETVFVDMKASNIMLASGESFVIELQGNGTGMGVEGSYVAPPGQPAYPDPLFLNGTPHAGGGWRIGFQSYILTCPVGAACNDGNACTTNDTCTAGGCVGTGVTCMASDQCHDAGVCNPGTGMCSNPPKADGSACDDGDACSTVDSCMTGACAGGSPVVCMVLDDCHALGTCDPATGMCSNPNVPDGDPCSDGDLCSDTDACTAGVCTSSPLVCAPPGDCEEAGVCAPATGTCDYATKPDGAPCPGGTCMAGACAPAATTSSTTASSTTTVGSSTVGSSTSSTGSATSSTSSSGSGGQGGQGGGAGNATPTGGGCDCSTSTGGDPRHGIAALALVLVGIARARRRRA